MRIIPIILALAILAAPVAVFGSEPPPTAGGEQGRLVRPVRFYGEQGLRSFLQKEPLEPPGELGTTQPDIQRHLFDHEGWAEVTGPKFAVETAFSEFYFGQNFGRNLIGRFFRLGYGAQASFYIHADKGLDVFLLAGVGQHLANHADLNGLRHKLSDFAMYTLLVGIKPTTDLEGALGLSGSAFRSTHLSLGLGVGVAFMQGVERLRPEPRDWFWAATTLGTAQLSLAARFEFFEGFHLFFEQALRFHTPPHASQSTRPDNETGPFVFFIWNAGFFFRF